MTDTAEPFALFLARQADWEWAAAPDALVASNPWHDQQGRFAPKGTGSQSSDVAPGGPARPFNEAEGGFHSFASRAYENEIEIGDTTVQPLVDPHIETERGSDGAVKVWRCRGTLVDTSTPRERQVGTFQRSFNPSTGVVDHEMLEISDSYQGMGIASQFNADAEKVYVAQGFSRIQVHAGLDVGGYTWARAGYRLHDDDTDSRENLHSRVRALANSNIGQPGWQAGSVAQMHELIDQGDMPQLAQLKAGRELLVGSAWYGYKDIP